MHHDLATRIDALDALMAERLHLRGGGLAAKLRGARGRMPRRLRRQAEELVAAQAMLASPALAAKLDAARLDDICARLEQHLQSIPDGKFARRDWSAALGLAALRVLIMLAVLGAVLVWRGFV